MDYSATTVIVLQSVLQDGKLHEHKQLHIHNCQLAHPLQLDTNYMPQQPTPVSRSPTLPLIAFWVQEVIPIWRVHGQRRLFDSDVSLQRSSRRYRHSRSILQSQPRAVMQQESVGHRCGILRQAGSAGALRFLPAMHAITSLVLSGLQSVKGVARGARSSARRWRTCLDMLQVQPVPHDVSAGAVLGQSMRTGNNAKKRPC